MLHDNEHPNSTHVKSYEQVIFLATDASGHLSLEVSPNPLASHRSATTIVGADVTVWGAWGDAPGSGGENNAADFVRVLGMSVACYRVSASPQGYVTTLEFPGYDNNNDAYRQSDSVNDRGGCRFTISTLVEGHASHLWVPDAGPGAGDWVPTMDLSVASTTALVLSTGDLHRRVLSQINNLTIHIRDATPSSTVMFVVRRAVQYSGGDVVSGSTTVVNQEPVAQAAFSVEHKDKVVSIRQKVAKYLHGQDPKGVFEKVGGKLLGFAHKALDVGTKVYNGATIVQRLRAASTASRMLDGPSSGGPTIVDMDTGKRLTAMADASSAESSLPYLLEDAAFV
jgi:hypothetical protein